MCILTYKHIKSYGTIKYYYKYYSCSINFVQQKSFTIITMFFLKVYNFLKKSKIHKKIGEFFSHRYIMYEYLKPYVPCTNSKEARDNFMPHK